MFNHRYFRTGIYAAAVLAGATFLASAGNLNPPAGPVNPTMVTLSSLNTKLNQILNEVNNGFTSEAGARGSGASIYMLADGFSGESTAQGHRDAIELDSVVFSVSGGKITPGQPAGRRILDEIVLTGGVERASMPLMTKQTAGREITDINIQWCRLGSGGEQCYIELVIQRAFIASTSIGWDSSGQERPVLQMSIAPFGDVTMIYRTYRPNGTVDQVITRTFDVRDTI